MPRKLIFALVGAAGYVAEKHFQAIKNTKHDLKYIVDVSDSLGKIDKFFPTSLYFKNLKYFNQYLKKKKIKIDYLVVCSPNHLHYSHIKFGLQIKANVICEKPIVIDPLSYIKLEKIAKKNNVNFFPILQLRFHPNIKILKKLLKKSKKNKILINYVTPRGNWYRNSWKSDSKKSGGLLFNIGIHFFDILIYLLGLPFKTKILKSSSDTVSGISFFKNCVVSWFLSIDKKYFTKKLSGKNRIFKVNNTKVDFSKNFENLHTICYKQILKNKKFDRDTILSSVKTVYDLQKLLK